MIAGHQLHVASAQAIAYAVDGKDAVHHGCAGADGNERIHVGCAVGQCLKALDVKLSVHVDDGQRQQKLAKGKADGIGVATKPVGQWQTCHAAHGKIHQRDQKHKADDEPVLHFVQLCFHRIFLRLLRRGSRCRITGAFLLYAGAVTGLGDRCDDGIGR